MGAHQVGFGPLSVWVNVCMCVFVCLCSTYSFLFVWESGVVVFRCCTSLSFSIRRNAHAPAPPRNDASPPSWCRMTFNMRYSFVRQVYLTRDALCSGEEEAIVMADGCRRRAWHRRHAALSVRGHAGVPAGQAVPAVPVSRPLVGLAAGCG